MDDDGRSRSSTSCLGGEGLLSARHIVFVVTVPVTANVLLNGQLTYLREQGFEVTVISSPGPELDTVARREGVRVVAIPFEREIEPTRDLTALARLTRALRSLRPDIVNASTAKAGLLGMMAAAALQVPARVYLLRGLRLETEYGLKRRVLAATERIAAACAHRVVCVSETLRARFVTAGYASSAKCVVLGDGSSNGVDITRFQPTPLRKQQALALRRDLGIPHDAPVIGFVGRPVPDKGMQELLDAFDRVRDSVGRTRLVLVGAGFAEDRLDPVVTRRFRDDVIVVGRVEDPAPYYALMDVLAFPSHREGFPNAPLEAAAAGIPVVGFRATGVTDAVVHDSTGLLVEIGDVTGLAAGLVRYLRDSDLRQRHGRTASERARHQFSRELVWERWRLEYERLLSPASLRRTPASDLRTQDPRPRDSGLS